jgi:HSP20 family protein
MEKEKTMANITRWDPFADLASVDPFNQFFNQSLSPFGLVRNREQSLTSPSFLPPVDVYEDEHTITVQAELPGIDEKDIDVRVENSVLTISGERRLENEEKRENYHRRERSYGRFTRSFTLPSTVDPENINAEFNNGLLKITLNKRAEAKPKQIKIGVNKGPVKGKAA